MGNRREVDEKSNRTVCSRSNLRHVPLNPHCIRRSLRPASAQRRRIEVGSPDNSGNCPVVAIASVARREFVESFAVVVESSAVVVESSAVELSHLLLMECFSMSPEVAWSRLKSLGVALKSP